MKIGKNNIFFCGYNAWKTMKDRYVIFPVIGLTVRWDDCFVDVVAWIVDVELLGLGFILVWERDRNDPNLYDMATV